MSDQEYFYLLMGIFALTLAVITVVAFWVDAKINKRIRQREKEFFESLLEKDKGGCGDEVDRR